MSKEHLIVDSVSDRLRRIYFLIFLRSSLSLILYLPRTNGHLARVPLMAIYPCLNGSKKARECLEQLSEAIIQMRKRAYGKKTRKVKWRCTLHWFSTYPRAAWKMCSEFVIIKNSTPSKLGTVLKHIAGHLACKLLFVCIDVHFVNILEDTPSKKEDFCRWNQAKQNI